MKEKLSNGLWSSKHDARTLLSFRNSEGVWEGELSSSALPTALTAIVFQKLGVSEERKEKALLWLALHQNEDGGFGDTSTSISNKSTSLLCLAALQFCTSKNKRHNEALIKLQEYFTTTGIHPSSDTLVAELLELYKTDYTFSVPILTVLLLCGVLPSNAIQKIPQLPFELVLVPQKFYRWCNMQVVSYALPALIAVGVATHTKRTNKWSPLYLIREGLKQRCLKKLASLLPESGGFLEASPLTAFVIICLVASNHPNHSAVKKGVSFLQNQQRNDGSLPIDTNLSTWVTTLSINALGEEMEHLTTENDRDTLRSFLLRTQFKTAHPFNSAAPGGWGWTSCSGAVPDADDTSGAILALLYLYSGKPEEITAIKNGMKWLLDLQNKDGGMPTFAKGWGKLPFDASCADISAHALVALAKGKDTLKHHFTQEEANVYNTSISNLYNYLSATQTKEGAWFPLWFGNQYSKNNANPVYGTSKVVHFIALAQKYLPGFNRIPTASNFPKLGVDSLLKKGREFIISQQNTDGSWGAEKGVEGSVEETSLALVSVADQLTGPAREKVQNWLQYKTQEEEISSSPIGLYFAALWYHEKLYPHIYLYSAAKALANTGD